MTDSQRVKKRHVKNKERRRRIIKSMEELFHSHHSNPELKTAIVAIMVCLRMRNQFVTKNNIKAGKLERDSCKRESRKEPVYCSYINCQNLNITCGPPESVSFIFSVNCWRCTHHGVGVGGPLEVIAALSVGIGTDT